jgi:hypothetical protein
VFSTGSSFAERVRLDDERPVRKSTAGLQPRRVAADLLEVRRALVLGLAVLALAGCGGHGGGGSYAQQLSSALASVSQPTSLDAASLAKLSQDYSRAAERLAALTPPAAVAEPHARMVTAMRAYAAELGRASTLTANQAAFEAEMAQAQTDAHAWTAAFDQIQASGYATYSTS